MSLDSEKFLVDAAEGPTPELLGPVGNVFSRLLSPFHQDPKAVKGESLESWETRHRALPSPPTPLSFLFSSLLEAGELPLLHELESYLFFSSFLSLARSLLTSALGRRLTSICALSRISSAQARIVTYL